MRKKAQKCNKNRAIFIEAIKLAGTGADLPHKQNTHEEEQTGSTEHDDLAGGQAHQMYPSPKNTRKTCEW